MSKNNVNPNHYKVAGRARQGEDIAQARNRQKYAEALVRERTEDGARPRKLLAPQDGKAPPVAAQARSAKTVAAKTQSTLLQTPPGHKRGHTVVPGRSAPHARFSKAPRSTSLRPAVTAPQRKATQAAKEAGVNVRGADTRGTRSTAQKQVSSHHEFDPVPATNAPGAIRNRPSPRPLPVRKG